MFSCMLTVVAATAFGGCGLDDVLVGSDFPDFRFSFISLTPPELQFSCSIQGDSQEDDLAKLLADGEPARQLAAARELWERRSRRQAANVIKFVSGSPHGGEEFRKLQREVLQAIEPLAILHELERGEYCWGAWLAFLRPHSHLVPALLAAINGQPDWKAETILALGNSGDARAFAPLLKALRSSDHRLSGHAASALEYFGNRDAEPQLIEALAEGNTWRQVNAMSALGKLGSSRALPALERFASDNQFTGVFNLKRAAQSAIDAITSREKQ